MKKPELNNIPIHKLVPGKYQPRCYFDEACLTELSESIKANGLIQPIVVRPIINDQYEIIAGERRWRACQLADMDEISCLVNQYTDEQAIAATLIENVNREDLNPIEVAKAYQRFVEEFGYLHEEIAAVVGKSRAKITNTLRLLRLDSRVQDFLIEGTLSDGHGKALAALTPHEQYNLAKKCVSNGWSVRKTEEQVKAFQQQLHTMTQSSQSNPDVAILERLISEQLGSEVKLEPDVNKKSGWLKVKYFDPDTLSGLLDKIGVEYEE